MPPDLATPAPHLNPLAPARPGANTRRPTLRHRTVPKSRSSSVPRSTASRRPLSVRASPSIFSLPNRPRRDKMTSIVEEPIQTPVTPAIVVEPPPPEPEARKPGPWSEWYDTRDRKRYWRARKLSDETWDYQYSNTKPSAAQRPGKPRASMGGRGLGLASFFFGIPASPPGGTPGNRPSGPPHPNPHPRPATLFPPPPPREDECASTNSDSTGMGAGLAAGLANRSRLRVPAARSSGTTFPSSVSTGKGKGSSLSMPSSEKVSTLSRLDEDGRPAPKPESRNNNVNNSKAKGRASPNTNANANAGAKPNGNTQPKAKNPKTKTNGKAPRRTQQGLGPASGFAEAAASGVRDSINNHSDNSSLVNIPTGGIAAGNAANAKKLHSKVKNEKELRIDTKRRIKGWLKDVGPEAPEPPAWDAEGLPIYK